MSRKHHSSSIHKSQFSSQQLNTENIPPKTVRRRHSAIAYGSSDARCGRHDRQAKCKARRNSRDLGEVGSFDLATGGSFKWDAGIKKSSSSKDLRESCRKCAAVGVTDPLPAVPKTRVSSPSSLEVPAGVVDIDAEVTDPLMCAQYAVDIFQYLHELERRWILPVNFLCRQPEINPTIRAILTDWLINVQVHLDFTEETLLLSVKMVDIYLHREQLLLENMQLLGITCIFMAAKFVEKETPSISELIYLTDHSYTRNQMLQMERIVLKILDFELSTPTPITFLDRFMLVEPYKAEMRDLSRYLLNLCLTEIYFVQFPASQLAAASLHLSRLIFKDNETATWTSGLVHYTRYTQDLLEECVKKMASILSHAKVSSFQGPRRKYALYPKYNSISSHPIINQNPVMNIATSEKLV